MKTSRKNISIAATAFIGIVLALYWLSSATSNFKYAVTPLTDSYREMLIDKKLWHQACPVPLERLREVTVSYYDFDRKKHTDGKLIVLDAVAEEVVNVFRVLFDKRFPLAEVALISQYEGNDETSMIANNTSSYNCRSITDGDTWSLHAYGLAIDLNPKQNPYLHFTEDDAGTARIVPPHGYQYVNRNNLRAGMVENIVDTLSLHGFTVWGGQWNTPIDYMHFQTSRFMAQMLAIMQTEHAKQFYQHTRHSPNIMAKLSLDDYSDISTLYRKAPETFMAAFEEHLVVLDKRGAGVFKERLNKSLNN